MTDQESGPKAGLSGVVEDVKGKAKEVVGEVTNDDSLSKEGQAQQDKARQEREVASKEAEAEAARAKAEAAEGAQRAAEKES